MTGQAFTFSHRRVYILLLKHPGFMTSGAEFCLPVISIDEIPSGSAMRVMAGCAPTFLHRRMHGFLHRKALVTLKAECGRLLFEGYRGFPAPRMVAGLFMTIKTTNFGNRFMEFFQAFQSGVTGEEATRTFCMGRPGCKHKTDQGYKQREHFHKNSCATIQTARLYDKILQGGNSLWSKSLSLLAIKGRELYGILLLSYPGEEQGAVIFTMLLAIKFLSHHNIDK
jgi:hypothetical protein